MPASPSAPIDRAAWAEADQPVPAATTAGPQAAPSADAGALPASAQSLTTGGGKRSLWFALLRYLVPLAAVAYLAYKVAWHEVLRSLALMPASALLLGVLAGVVAMALQAARWGLLLRACGAQAPPRWAVLFRWYWIGGFYNTYLPGGLSGDVVRAVAVQRASGGFTASLGIVLLERLLGFIATLLLITFGALAFHVEGRLSTAAWRWIGVATFVLAAGVSVGTAPLARFLPERLGRIVARLPVVRSRALLGAALLLSCIGHLGGVLTAHALIAGVSQHVQLADSLVNVPLIGIMQYLPVAIGGAGVREAGFVALYAASHVPPESAFAVAVAMGALRYVLSAAGGLLQWWPGAKQPDAIGASGREPPVG